MADLKTQLIRLGTEHKALRSHIRPVLAELEKEASKITTHFEYDPGKGRIDPLRQPVEVDARERCPVCMKPLGDGSEIVATPMDVMGAEGAHKKCIEREVMSSSKSAAGGPPNEVLKNVSNTSEFKAVVKGGEALDGIKDAYLKEAQKHAPQRSHDYMGKMFDRSFWPAFSDRLAELANKGTFRHNAGRALDSALKMGLDAADKEIYGTVHTDVFGYPPRDNKRDWSKLDV